MSVASFQGHRPTSCHLQYVLHATENGAGLEHKCRPIQGRAN